MGFKEHELRRQVVREMHLRRFPEFALPADITQWVKLIDASEREMEHSQVLAMPAVPQQDASGHRRHVAGLGAEGLRISWERHSEASTTTLIRSGVPALPNNWTDHPGGDAAAAVEWAEKLPGSVIRATRILIVADDESARPVLEAAEFLESDLVSCHVAGGARIWTDFRIHGDDYGRMVIAANGLLPGDLARCVQRLQELGNYRNMALLGLPLAQENWARLDALERALDEAGRAQTSPDLRDDDLLLDISRLSAALLTVTTQCGYRMSATAAYAEIVTSRLAELDVRPIAGFHSLIDFTDRRFKPAVRTCATLTARLDALNERAGRFTAMLRTRVETRIENQNGRLLASLDRSAKTQLRLQHLVEGLSTVAISYYALSLLAYPVRAAGHYWPDMSEYVVLGAAMPIVVAAVFLFMSALRRRLTNGGD